MAPVGVRDSPDLEWAQWIAMPRGSRAFSASCAAGKFTVGRRNSSKSRAQMAQTLS